MGTICAVAAVLVVTLATTAAEPGIAADSEAMRRAGTAALVVLGVAPTYPSADQSGGRVDGS